VSFTLHEYQVKALVTLNATLQTSKPTSQRYGIIVIIAICTTTTTTNYAGLGLVNYLNPI
jgi:hypothetical protein